VEKTQEKTVQANTNRSDALDEVECFLNIMIISMVVFGQVTITTIETERSEVI
jgi:hypothetical protein